MAVEPKIAIALVDLNLAVWYGITIRIYASGKFWRILIWGLYYRSPNCQIFQLYDIISSSEQTISRWHLRESQEEAAIGNGDLREKIEHKDCKGTPVVHCTKQPVHIVDAPQPEFHEEVPASSQEGAMVSRIIVPNNHSRRTGV